MRSSSVLVTLALSGVGLLGALPMSGAAKPVALLAWLGLVSLPLGILAGGLGLRGGLVYVALPWLVALWLLARVSGIPLLVLNAWVAVTGLFAIGCGLGALARRPAWRAASLVACASMALALFPTGAGLLAKPWPPRLAARSFGLSPVTLVQECAGIDWLHHHTNYGPVGADWIGPDLRQPWRGGRVGPLLLLLGALSVIVAGRVARGRDERPGLR